MARWIAAWCAALLLHGCAIFDNTEPAINTQGAAPTHYPDVPFVVSTEQAVDAMLALARVGARDVVYDLGCGDGRIVIAAAARYGARGVGIDMDPMPLRFARIGARRAGVEDRVQFVRRDMFEADLREATVVMLYLSPEVNLRLLPKLLAELPAGARIVSQKFPIGDWPPQQIVRVDGVPIHLWTVPDKAK